MYRDVLQVLKIHTEDSSVLSSGFLAMSTLLEMDPFAASHMAMCGDFSLFLTAVKKHSSQFGVVSCAFRSLRCIVKYVLNVYFIRNLHNMLYVKLIFSKGMNILKTQVIIEWPSLSYEILHERIGNSK